MNTVKIFTSYLLIFLQLQLWTSTTAFGGTSCSANSMWSVMTSKFLPSNHTGVVCDLNLGASQCSGNATCDEVTDAVPVTVATSFDYNGKKYDVTELAPGGSTCLDNKQCLSGVCLNEEAGGNTKTCSRIGMCSTCVSTGNKPVQGGYGCCSGLVKNLISGKCQELPNVPLDLPGDVGSIDNNACVFKYSDELQDYIDNRFEEDMQQLVAFMWLFGNVYDASTYKYIPSSSVVFDEKQIYIDRSDFYPFNDTETPQADGSSIAYDRGDLHSPPGIKNIALALKNNYTSGLSDFITLQDELLAKIAVNRSNFESNQFDATKYQTTEVKDLNAGVGEYGTNYYQMLADYYAAVAARESSLIGGLGTAQQSVQTYYDTVLETLKDFKFDSEQYEPWQCHRKTDDHPESQPLIYETWYDFQCIRGMWSYQLTNNAGQIVGGLALVAGGLIVDPLGGAGTGVAAMAAATNMMAPEYFVDPVFRFTGHGLNKVITKRSVAKSIAGLEFTYEYKTDYADNHDISEAYFLTTLQQDIYDQMVSAVLASKDTTTTDTGTSSSEAYIAQFAADATPVAITADGTSKQTLKSLKLEALSIRCRKEVWWKRKF